MTRNLSASFWDFGKLSQSSLVCVQPSSGFLHFDSLHLPQVHTSPSPVVTEALHTKEAAVGTNLQHQMKVAVKGSLPLVTENKVCSGLCKEKPVSSDVRKKGSPASRQSLFAARQTPNFTEAASSPCAACLDLATLSSWLDSVILEVYCNPKDSVILCPTLPKASFKNWQSNQELQISTNNSSFAKNMNCSIRHTTCKLSSWVLRNKTKFAGLSKIILYISSPCAV